MIRSFVASLLVAVAPLLWGSSAQYGTYSNFGYHWNNDAWCDSHGPQRIWVRDPSSWGVLSTQTFNTDCWVQTYPHIGWWGGGLLSQYPQIISTEQEGGPSHTYQWEAAYDIWLNSSPGADSGYEVMIWTDTHNVSPGGPVLATPVISGVQYRVYQGQGGNGPATWFVRTANTTTATTDIRSILLYLASHNGPANPRVDTIEFGWEIWGTDNTLARFQVHEYSLEV